MQIVIDIPEETYNQIMEFGLENMRGKICYKAIKNGTVLPEHGRLGDLDELYKKVQNEDYDTEDEKSMKALFRYLIRQTNTILKAWGNEE